MKVLPREVLHKIFADLKTKDLYTCMFVFRSWYPELSAYLYRYLVWSTRFDRQHVLRLLATRIDGSKLGKYVKMIHFAHDGQTTHPNFTSVDFEQLVYNLPYLGTINISPRFVKFLNDTPTNKFNSVTEITVLSGNHEQQNIDTHFTTNLRLKHQITTLRLESLNITMLEGVYRRILPLLSSFKVLTSLFIYDDHMQEKEKCINVTSILNHCSNLKFLDYKSKCSWRIPTTKNALHINLSTISISVPNFAEQHMEYMLQCLPSIKELYLYFDIQSRSFKETTIRVKPSVAKKFPIYLEQMDYVEITSGPLYREREEEASSLFTTLVMFWDLVRDICGEGGYCDILVSFAWDSSSGVQIKKKYKNLKVYLEIPIWAIMNTANFWTRQLDFLTFTAVEIHSRGKFDDFWTRDDFVDTEYSSLVEPFIKLLLQQQDDRPPPLYVDICPQSLVFYHPSIHYVPSIHYLSISGHTANRSAYDYGCIKCFTLRNSMLNDLGQLYSQVKYLILYQCILTEEDGIYHIDLSTFTNVLELEIDFDNALGFGEGQSLEQVYIQCVNVLNPQASTYYHYHNYILEYLGPQEEVPIRRGHDLVRIHHVGLENIVLN